MQRRPQNPHVQEDHSDAVRVVVVDPVNNQSFTPPGFDPGQIRMIDGGSNFSGVIGELMPGVTKKLLSAQKLKAEGMTALATIYVRVKDLNRIGPAEVAFAQRLILHVAWQSGRGGDDEVEVDCSRGAVFTLPGTESVDIRAELRSDNPAIGMSVTVEATASWGTSVSDKPVFSTPGPFVFPLAGALLPSGFLPIPNRAQKVTFLLSDPTQIATISVDFYRDAVAGSQLYVYPANINPLQKIDIVGGVRWYQIFYTGGPGISVLADFELAM